MPIFLIDYYVLQAQNGFRLMLKAAIEYMHCCRLYYLFKINLANLTKSKISAI